MHTINFKDFSDDEFPLAVIYSAEHRGYPIHNHDFTELVIVFSGAGIHTINDEEYVIKEGDVFVINPPVSHSYSESCSTELVNILFDPERLAIPKHDLRKISGYHSLFLLEPKLRTAHEFKSRIRVTLESQSVIRSLVRKIQEELKIRRPGYRSLATASFTELLVTICRNIVGSTDKQYQSVYEFGKVLSYLEQNYAKPITLEELAKSANMSKRSFQRQFKEALNMSPINYLLKLRLQNAEKMLKQTQKSISEIAFACGFSDSNYFTRQFRIKMGIPPTTFRKQGLPR
jgi:AraC-like DNA-binding protein